MRIDYRSPTVSEYTRLRESVGRWKTDNDAVVIALRNSLFSVVAIQQGNVIGFGRVVGDGGWVVFLYSRFDCSPRISKQRLGKEVDARIND